MLGGAPLRCEHSTTFSQRRCAEIHTNCIKMVRPSRVELSVHHSPGFQEVNPLKHIRVCGSVRRRGRLKIGRPRRSRFVIEKRIGKCTNPKTGRVSLDCQRVLASEGTEYALELRPTGRERPRFEDERRQRYQTGAALKDYVFFKDCDTQRSRVGTSSLLQQPEKAQCCLAVESGVHLETPSDSGGSLAQSLSDWSSVARMNQPSSNKERTEGDLCFQIYHRFVWIVRCQYGSSLRK